MQGSKTKDWADALRRAVHRESEGKGSPKWLDVIANKVCEAAADGDSQAFKEIGDRLDGKPKQENDNNHHIAGSLEIVKRIAKDS
tara:strand:- start:334 stop:588 length:255 start_codon:yes stop_codon:yes gene_type:complete